MKLFGTDGIRGDSSKYPFDNETLSIIGKAIACVLGAQGQDILLISDTRQSAKRICAAIAAGIAAAKGRPVLGGVLPTPAASFLMKGKKYKAAVVVSASHNPFMDNGIKIFASNGLKLKDETEIKVENLIVKIRTSKDFPAKLKKPLPPKSSLLQSYENFIAAQAPKNILKGKTIVIDCANGAAYKCAPVVFKKLGAKVIALNTSPSGKNINLNCGALHPQNCAAEVVKSKAFCGFCFDGDADRLICIDETGAVRDGDFFLFAMAKYLKEKKVLKNNVLVTTVMANLGLPKAAKQEKIRIIKTKVGDRYVLEAINKNKASLGGEQSGHFIFRDILPTGDGLLSAVYLLKAVCEKKQSLSEFFGGLKKFPQILINEKVAQKPPFSELKKTSALIKSYEKSLGKNGRILVRYSGTENLARVMVEGINAQEIEETSKEIMKTLREEINDKVRN